MKKQEFYDKAEMLFVESGLTLSQINEITKVSTRTLGDWKREGNWAEKRTNYVKLQNSCCSSLYKMIKGLTDQVNDQIISGEAVDKSLVWSIEKIAKSIPKLRPYEKDSIQEQSEPQESKTESSTGDLSVRIGELVDAKLTGDL